MKKCNVCKQDKSMDSFHKDMSRKDNLCQRCKECKSKIDKIPTASERKMIDKNLSEYVD